MNVHAKSRLILEPLRTLRSEDKGQAAACPARAQAIPCTVRAVTRTATDSNVVGLVSVAAFAADLSAEQAALMAATQRPVAEVAFSEPTGVPAWKTLPSWAVVATGDKAASSNVIRAMAKRAGATITEVQGSHVIMLSQPQIVTDVILAADVNWSLPEPGGATYAD